MSILIISENTTHIVLNIFIILRKITELYPIFDTLETNLIIV